MEEILKTCAALKFSENIKKKYPVKKKRIIVTYISVDANPEETKGLRGLLTVLRSQWVMALTSSGLSFFNQ